MDFIAIVTLLVIVMDPIGLVPVVQGILQGFTPRQKTKILIREQFFALLVLLLFLACGNKLMNFLQLEQATLNLSGGIMLFMVALGMVFPGLSVIASVTDSKSEKGTQVPFIVPIAVPLIAGPSALALIMLQSAQAKTMGDNCLLVGAVLTAWLVCTAVMLLSQYILKFMGKRGTAALERLMGMLLILISVQMFLNGLHSYQ